MVRNRKTINSIPYIKGIKKHSIFHAVLICTLYILIFSIIDMAPYDF